MAAFGVALVVEDNAHLRSTLATALRECARLVGAAESVADARRLIADATPDLVLLDFDLPDGNAFDVLATLAPVSPTPALTPFVRGMVGRMSMSAVEREVRAVMVSEALARAQGSRRGAAKILDISRQALQHILRKGQA